MIASKKQMWDEWAGRQPNLLKEGGRLSDGDKIIPITKPYWCFDSCQHLKVNLVDSLDIWFASIWYPI